jgi:predicted negative regulator of RcsB-dependent stress response
MAIDDLLDEHEQSERVLQWLRNNGVGLVGGIVLGFAAIGGWKWWGHHTHQQKLDEADRYNTAITAVEADDPKAAELVKGLPDGLLSTLAALDLAKAQVAAGQGEAAIETLRGADVTDPGLAEVVNQRLARLLIDSEQADAALKLLADVDTPAALEVRGDAEYALGKPEQAREFYQKALAGMDVGSPQRRMLELKLTEVGGVPAEAEARS